MGVRGLTTFIANRSRQYLDHYELHDTYLVIDGNSIACQLYKWHCKSNDCFGGDYDKYARVVTDFFQLLFDCKVTPLVIFDGAYEKRKMKTVYSRIKSRISAAKDLNSVTEGRVSVFPLLMRELFVDILLKLKVQCVKCDFEGDNDAAQLARTLQCPILSYDSDFYIFDVLYLPFSNMDLKLRKKKNFHYIACDVYRVEKFLNSFGGLDKVNLPLLAVMLGNDYIKKRAFSAFYRELKIYKTKQNEQQTLIKSVIVWLKNETPESALRKILGRYKLHFRKRLAKRIQKAIEAYQSGNTPVCSYFNLDVVSPQNSTILVPKPEEIESLGEEEIDNENEEGSGSEDTPEEEEENEETKIVLKFAIPNFFRENFRKCLYPACFMDMIVSKTYFCIIQIEDFSSEHSHSISLDILAAIYKILTFPQTKKLLCVARNDHGHLKKFVVPFYEKDVPKLTEIETMDVKASRNTLLKILNIEDDTLNVFPNSWHLFLISLKYWVTNSKNKVDLPYIYSIILCSIILNYVDNKIGFYRSTKSFVSKYSTNSQNIEKSSETPKTITAAMNEIDSDNSVACMKKLIHYFQMDAKMRSYIRLFDRSIIHELAQFQSCFLHIKYLNSLLNSPFPSLFISDFYDGTFIYNMITNLQKRTDLKSYMKILLEDCPKILDVFELMMGQIEDEIICNVGKHEPPKKRRRKKKTAKDVPEVVHSATVSANEEEDYAFDANNKYSLLSFINK